MKLAAMLANRHVVALSPGFLGVTGALLPAKRRILDTCSTPRFLAIFSSNVLVRATVLFHSCKFSLALAILLACEV